MRLLESTALNQLKIGGAVPSVARSDGSDGQLHGGGMHSRQRLLMQYIVVSNLHQSLTDFIKRHNDSQRSDFVRWFGGWNNLSDRNFN
jgi:hypothetical protein